MYKKIMFLIITLSIIINVGNSTVVMAKENIVIFTVNGEYIYTVHSDHKKYAPCKIKIDTGEIIYTDGEN